MIKILIFFAVIAGAVMGLGYLQDAPGSLNLDWFGYHIETSPVVGLSLVLASAVALGLLWTLIRYIFGIPSLISLARRSRKRERGLDAISRGILAAGAGDLQRARKASAEAKKLLPNEPLTLLLEAQAAQLSGDRDKAEQVFRAMIERGDTKLLGLRGLHAERLREGDHDLAQSLAHEAQTIRPLSWSGQAVLDRHTAHRDWEAAHLCVDQNLRAKIVDPAAARRQKAVLDTAMATDCEASDPDRAVKLLRAALKKAPDLTPAAVLLGRLLARKGDTRAAAKILETTYAAQPHPDLARAFIDLRPGDSAASRLTRAKILARNAPGHHESAMAIAVAAIGAGDFVTARAAMAPLVASGQRPTARMCVIMAELEDREHDAPWLVREWLSRASRAPRDALWYADGQWSKQWAPVSPVTGKLDAYRWTEPKEELSGPVEEPPPAYEPPAPKQALEPPAPPAEIAAPEPAAEAVPPEPAPEPEAELIAPEKPAAPSPSRPTPQPVIFPLASPPDDPGPKQSQARAKTF
jgi:HemY protein